VTPRSALRRARRIVVKVGTSLLAPPTGGVHPRRFGELAREVAGILDSRREVVLVSSGAVGLGARRLELADPPESIPVKQAAAAVGQIDLCRRYERAFGRHGYRVGQILLTHAGLADRERFLNARHTLQALLAARVVPIVNENDSVATEELRFGDNDQLAAQVVNVTGAELLVLLTDTDGVFDRPPSEGGGARVPEIREVTARVLRTTTREGSSLGSGGMRAKLEGARTAARFGVPTVIADGRSRGTLARILAGEEVGTLIHGAASRLSSRKHWIAYSLKPRGSVRLDAGAVSALLEGGRSLLPIGVVEVAGRFSVGDPVSCVGPDGEEIARGLIAYNRAELEVIKGHRTSRIQELLGFSNGPAIIHRDDLVLLHEHSPGN
jgi:glutamate 5-kinase